MGMLNIIADIIFTRNDKTANPTDDAFLKVFMNSYKRRTGLTRGSSIIAGATTNHVVAGIIVNIVIAAAAVDEIIAAAANDIHALSDVAVDDNIVIAVTTANVQASSLIGSIGLRLTISTSNGYTAILTLGNIVGATHLTGFPNNGSLIALGYTVRIILGQSIGELLRIIGPLRIESTRSRLSSSQLFSECIHHIGIRARTGKGTTRKRIMDNVVVAGSTVNNRENVVVASSTVNNRKDVVFAGSTLDFAGLQHSMLFGPLRYGLLNSVYSAVNAALSDIDYAVSYRLGAVNNAVNHALHAIGHTVFKRLNAVYRAINQALRTVYCTVNNLLVEINRTVNQPLSAIYCTVIKVLYAVCNKVSGSLETVNNLIVELLLAVNNSVSATLQEINTIVNEAALKAGNNVS